MEMEMWQSGHCGVCTIKVLRPTVAKTEAEETAEDLSLLTAPAAIGSQHSCERMFGTGGTNLFVYLSAKVKMLLPDATAIYWRPFST